MYVLIQPRSLNVAFENEVAGGSFTEVALLVNLRRISAKAREQVAGVRRQLEYYYTSRPDGSFFLASSEHLQLCKLLSLAVHFCPSS